MPSIYFSPKVCTDAGTSFLAVFSVAKILASGSTEQRGSIEWAYFPYCIITIIIIIVNSSSRGHLDWHSLHFQNWYICLSNTNRARNLLCSSQCESCQERNLDLVPNPWTWMAFVERIFSEPLWVVATGRSTDIIYLLHRRSGLSMSIFHAEMSWWLCH